MPRGVDGVEGRAEGEGEGSGDEKWRGGLWKKSEKEEGNVEEEAHQKHHLRDGVF